jgi:ribonuclease HII
MILNHAQEWGLRQVAAAGGNHVIGIDEVGLGACAGPLVVCGAVFPRLWSDPTVKDSKQYSGGGITAHNKRMAVMKNAVIPACIFRALEVVPHSDIDALGLGPAVEDAMRRVAIQCTHYYPGCAVVIDGMNKPFLKKASVVVAIPKGDGLVPAVSAASVIAKTTRDAMMIANDAIYPGYDFDEHMGYFTQKHEEAIRRLGPCAIHRRSFKNVRDIIRERGAS